MHPKDAEEIANSVDPDHDQTAPLGAVWSGSALFAQTCVSENLGSFSTAWKPTCHKHVQASDSIHGRVYESETHLLSGLLHHPPLICIHWLTGVWAVLFFLQTWFILWILYDNGTVVIETYKK